MSTVIRFQVYNIPAFYIFIIFAFGKRQKKSAHVGKYLDRLGKAFDGLVGVAMLYAVTDAVLDMTSRTTFPQP